MFSSITFSKAIWEQGMRWMNCSHGSLLWSLVFLGTSSLGTIPASQDPIAPRKGLLMAKQFTYPVSKEQKKLQKVGCTGWLLSVSNSHPAALSCTFFPTCIRCRSTSWINLTLCKKQSGVCTKIGISDVVLGSLGLCVQPSIGQLSHSYTPIPN